MVRPWSASCIAMFLSSLCACALVSAAGAGVPAGAPAGGCARDGPTPLRYNVARSAGRITPFEIADRALPKYVTSAGGVLLAGAAADCARAGAATPSSIAAPIKNSVFLITLTPSLLVRL